MDGCEAEDQLEVGYVRHVDFPGGPGRHLLLEPLQHVCWFHVCSTLFEFGSLSLVENALDEFHGPLLGRVHGGEFGYPPIDQRSEPGVVLFHGVCACEDVHRVANCNVDPFVVAAEFFAEGSA